MSTDAAGNSAARHCRPGRPATSGLGTTPTGEGSSRHDRDPGREERYLIISSDCHAGLPSAEYRGPARPRAPRHLRPPPGRAHQVARAGPAGPAQRRLRRGVGGRQRRGCGRRDAARRDKELDADGVVGEVIFPDADAVTAGASVSAPAWPQPATPTRCCSWPAPGRNTAGWPSCAPPAPSGAGVAIVPIFDVEAAVAEIRRARETGLRGGILIPRCGPTRPTTTHATTCVGHLRRAGHAGPRALGLGRQGVVRPHVACTPPRCGGGRRGRCGS